MSVYSVIGMYIVADIFLNCPIAIHYRAHFFNDFENKLNHISVFFGLVSKSFLSVGHEGVKFRMQDRFEGICEPK